MRILAVVFIFGVVAQPTLAEFGGYPYGQGGFGNGPYQPYGGYPMPNGGGYGFPGGGFQNPLMNNPGYMQFNYQLQKAKQLIASIQKKDGGAKVKNDGAASASKSIGENLKSFSDSIAKGQKALGESMKPIAEPDLVPVFEASLVAMENHRKKHDSFARALDGLNESMRASAEQLMNSISAYTPPKKSEPTTSSVQNAAYSTSNQQVRTTTPTESPFRQSKALNGASPNRGLASSDSFVRHQPHLGDAAFSLRSADADLEIGMIAEPTHYRQQ